MAVVLFAPQSLQAREVDLAFTAQYLEDPEGTLSIGEVASEQFAHRFQVAGSEGMNFGYSNSTYWVRVPLADAMLGRREGLLEVGYFTLEHITFFAPGHLPIHGGRHDEDRSGTWPFRHAVFPVTLNESAEYFYLRVQSSGSLTIPLTLWDLQEFDTHNQRLYLGLGLYYGALLALMVYNLLLFISLRERNYILYSTFAACIGLGIVSGNGIGHQFLWPTWSEWSTLISNLLLGLALVFAILFTQSFLNTRRHTPRLHRLLWVTVTAALVGVVGGAAAGITPRLVEQGLVIIGFVTAVLIVGVSVIALRKGERSARFYLLAWGILWTGTTVAGMRNFGLVPTNDLTAYSLQLSSALEMLLLSFALADRIHLEREKKERAQAEAIAAKQQMVETLQFSEQRLEQQVKERTERLDQSLKREQRVLEQYVRFGALISHEFRNPLGIIKSQATLMKKELAHGIHQDEKRIDAIRGAASRLEVMFEEWLQSDRLNRDKNEARPTTIALNAWVGTLVKECTATYGDHTFDLRLDDEVTTVSADESMLRVALYNLIDNAVKYSPKGTTIAVESCAKSGMVGIAVCDQGKGISEADRQRIYDEYFRVAPDGAVSGFGLGLAFVNKIAQLHRGEIEVKSELGKGSRFCLWLPVVPACVE